MSPSETQTLKARIADAQKRKGPLEGPIKQILESQDRMEANVAAIRATTAAMQRWADAITASAPKTFLARLFWRLGL